MEDLVDASTTLVSLPIPSASNCCSAFGCLSYFFAGVLVLALVEFVCVFYFSLLLSAKPAQNPNPASSLKCASEGGVSTFSLQGNLWVAPLPEGDWNKVSLQKPGKDKEIETEKDEPKESLKRGVATKGVLKIAPVQRHAVLKQGVLLLKGADGREEQIALEGCEVLSISADSTPGGKWAKTFPIKLHHPTRTLYGECKGCVFYAESGFEKETWCEVLRANAKHPMWLIHLKKEFREYTDRAEKRVPYLNRFHSGRDSDRLLVTRKEEKLNDFKNSEDSPSKKRLILKRILRCGTKSKEKISNDIEELENSTRRNNQLSREPEEGSSRSVKENVISGDHDDSKSASCASIESITRSESTSSESDAERSVLGVTQNDKKKVKEVLAATLMHGNDNGMVMKEIDQGQLCLNMIVARLFFDFYHSNTREEWTQHQFKELISGMETPSYIKSITGKEFDLGKEPPFATAFRMLPADARGTLTMEVDLEWHGGCFITIETRVDARAQKAREKMASHPAESGSTGDAAVALESSIGEVLGTTELSEVSSTLMDARQISASKTTGTGDDSSKRGGWMHSVKAMISHVADQVSQVAFLLKIRLVSVKGTCIISLKAPPSDRLWFSFKEMPDIDLVPEQGINERQFKNGCLGNFIANQIKVQIREKIVMPHYQELFLNWMMGDKDDWLPRSAFPVAFSAVQHSDNERQNSKNDNDMQSSPVEEKNKSGQTHSRSLNADNNRQDKPEIRQPPGASEPSSATLSTIKGKESDSKKPSFDTDDRSRGNSLELNREFFADVSERAVGAAYNDYLQQSEGSALKSESHHLPNQVANQEHSEVEPSKGSDSRVSRRAKMLNFGKKVGSKVDERRRIVVEKLREKIAEGSEDGSPRHPGSGRK
ncbi:uncharacterized protein [Physcomitrium patens]|uniref:uncharacterized protein isoform X2 n=1 Tax=Physcomitrium patens TaxID=3218 RepID=UPI003CCE0011